MNQLEKFVNKENSRNSIFGGKPMVIGVDNQRIAQYIDSGLSPFDPCDGEPVDRRRHVQAMYRALTGAARELLKLDPSVKFNAYCRWSRR